MEFSTLLFLFLTCIAGFVQGRSHVHEWDIAWKLAAPDGFVRPVVAINGLFPGPEIHIQKGDRVIIKANNNLGNTSTTLHFHGIFQNGSTAQDGPNMVTQCPIPAGGSLTYDFVVNQPGTYFYHSHFEGQYPDGLRGPLIVHDHDNPYARHIDEEIVLTLSDWYHEQISTLSRYYLNNTLNSDSPEPIPYSALINDTQNLKINIQPGKTYFLRIINFACFAQMYLKFDDHNMTIIEVDGVYTEPEVVDTVYLTVAQRVGVLLTTKSTTDKNYAALAKLDETMFDGYNDTDSDGGLPPDVNPDVTAWLVYNEAKPLPPPLKFTLNELSNRLVDDFDLVPYDKMPLLTNPTKSFVMNLSFFSLDGQNRAGFNNITWLPQLTPSLFTALTTGDAATNPEIYGINANAMVLNHNEVVELVINNFDSGSHPLHIHGHNVQLAARVAGPNDDSQVFYNGDDSKFPATPIRRDTWLIAPGGYTVVRFRADNPGVWFFHCHMDWHNIAGLAATFIEAPLELQKQQTLPREWNDNCKKQGFPIAGNAAGSTKNYTDLTGAPTLPGVLEPFDEDPPI